MARPLQTLGKNDALPLALGMDQKKRETIAKELSGFLASTYLLYIKSLYYHWNVTGPHFVGLHELFEHQYQELHTAGDELAERVRALGYFTPGTVSELVTLSEIKDDPSLPRTPEAMVKNLLKDHEHCSTQARRLLEVGEKLEDPVTVDMMVRRMTVHDKAAWMLRAILE